MPPDIVTLVTDNHKATAGLRKYKSSRWLQDRGGLKKNYSFGTVILRGLGVVQGPMYYADELWYQKAMMVLTAIFALLPFLSLYTSVTNQDAIFARSSCLLDDGTQTCTGVTFYTPSFNHTFHKAQDAVIESKKGCKFPDPVPVYVRNTLEGSVEITVLIVYAAACIMVFRHFSNNVLLLTYLLQRKKVLKPYLAWWQAQSLLLLTGLWLLIQIFLCIPRKRHEVANGCGIEVTYENTRVTNIAKAYFSTFTLFITARKLGPLANDFHAFLNSKMLSDQTTCVYCDITHYTKISRADALEEFNTFVAELEKGRNVDEFSPNLEMLNNRGCNVVAGADVPAVPATPSAPVVGPGMKRRQVSGSMSYGALVSGNDGGAVNSAGHAVVPQASAPPADDNDHSAASEPLLRKQ